MTALDLSAVAEDAGLTPLPLAVDADDRLLLRT
jgi:hypothetical protein